MLSLTGNTEVVTMAVITGRVFTKFCSYRPIKGRERRVIHKPSDEFILRAQDLTGEVGPSFSSDCLVERINVSNQSCMYDIRVHSNDINIDQN